MRSKAYSRGLILHGFVSAFDSRKAFSSSRDSSVKTSRALTCFFWKGISGSKARMSLSKASGRFTLSTGQRRIQQDQIVLEVARRKRKATRLETYRVRAIVGPLVGACSSWLWRRRLGGSNNNNENLERTGSHVALIDQKKQKAVKTAAHGCVCTMYTYRMMIIKAQYRLWTPSSRHPRCILKSVDTA